MITVALSPDFFYCEHKTVTGRLGPELIADILYLIGFVLITLHK